MLRHEGVKDQVEGFVRERDGFGAAHAGFIEVRIVHDPRVGIDSRVVGDLSPKREMRLIAAAGAGPDFEDAILGTGARQHEI